ncbi:(1-_4)-alpha-D-glucan 1-alpha-D-glucosylmutase [Luteibacter sp. UNC138MFCol5.1]|uniref:malto-oligosyltrehalose synthase n=1 Tax=Luteibacter sp. UNC138MFCol5.1 TaxID=1502774 RepID=UPI0008AD35EE|nr:malto-oligosyltrehalose synthase [Luteibacter sp. UNC138MFCol5.1]SEO56093.1 (1->4)-alpha-D-glucan 1-alpha-D-glucosylmutase [Luteibacter sp. UNC138MFCol5.1]
MSPPRALARLQFHAGFTLDDAAGVVPYYASLGVSHLYASPILRARAGSTHGYDVVDCHEVNPEIGGEDALRRLVKALRDHRMGLVVDIVPNHMGVGVGNAWWMDVLRHGRESRYAGYFDIDWQAPDPLLRGRLLLPILGAGYDETLRGGHLKLEHRRGEWVLRVYDDRLPLAPATVAGLADDAAATHDASTDEGRAALHALIEKQHYRLAFWKLASDMVNYRRFFDINELAGLRIERTAVFEDTHKTIFRLYAEGLIDGVRCDHVDGLADPRRYCRQLRHRLERLRPTRPEGAPRDAAYLVVEKILAHDEALRLDWRTDGTTGYEFMDQVSAVLHDEAGESSLTGLWRSLTGDAADFGTQAVRARRQILVDSFEAELDRTARALFAAARADVATRDVSLAAIRRVLVELLVHFPVYRTYAGGTGRDAYDEAVFARAVEGALRTIRVEDVDLLHLVARWLGGEAPRALPPGPVRRARERAIAVFQQATSPVAAKAVEDTAGYRYGRLLSRNEVGVDAAHLAMPPAEFHARCIERADTVPHNLLATATHDHKRGEDLRARLAVLSEEAGRWVVTVERWRARHADLRQRAEGRMAPSASEELMLYQMLVGAWPLDLAPDDQEGVERFASRIAAWQRKALREAKRWTRWTSPNEPYEDACEDFLRALLSGDAAGELAAFAGYIAAPGAANGLAQTVLRLTTPGVPDLYQGTDYWDFSLVDPDNRRPVDFAARRASLERDLAPAELLPTWRGGGIKQAVIARLLRLRAKHPDLFAQGGYRALDATGPAADHVLAFVRERRGERLVVAVARHTARWLGGADGPAIPAACWEGTTLQLPDGDWTSVLGEATVEGGTVAAADLFGGLPCAAWLSRHG